MFATVALSNLKCNKLGKQTKTKKLISGARQGWRGPLHPSLAPYSTNIGKKKKGGEIVK
jgi:hypothetical protein